MSLQFGAHGYAFGGIAGKALAEIAIGQGDNGGTRVNLRNQRVDFTLAEAVTADGDDTGWRRGHSERVTLSRKPAGIGGVNIIRSVGC